MTVGLEHSFAWRVPTSRTGGWGAAERRMKNVRRLFLAWCEDGLVEDGMGKLSLETIEAQQWVTTCFLLHLSQWLPLLSWLLRCPSASVVTRSEKVTWFPGPSFFPVDGCHSWFVRCGVLVLSR